MPTIKYTQSFERDVLTDALINVEIRVEVPVGYELSQQELDTTADDALQSVVFNLREVEDY